MGAGKRRSIHFRQDRRKIVFFRFFLKTQVSLFNCYNVSMLWDQTLTHAWVKWKICTPDQNSMALKSVIYKKSTKMSFPPDRYSNKFLNACINHHVHVGYLKRIEFYSPLGIRHVFLCSINNNKNETLTTSAVNRCVAAILFQKICVWRTGNTRKYRQSDVYIDQCDIGVYTLLLFCEYHWFIYWLKIDWNERPKNWSLNY